MPLGTRAGTLRPEVAQRLGLPESVAVAVGNVDALVSVPGAGVEQPGAFVIVIGTSICDMVVHPEEIRLPGITGVVKDGILPGLYGYEAGQAAVGDMLAWFVENVAMQAGSYAELERAASEIAPGETGLVALDWFNGNRTILADADLTRRDLRSDAAEHARGDLPRAARVDRVRKPADHGELRGARPRADRDRRLRRDRRAQPADDAAARRHQRTQRAGPGFGRDPGARSGAVRRRRRRAFDGHRGGDRGHAARERSRTYEPDPDAKRTYDRVYAIYRGLYDLLGRSQVELAARAQADPHDREEAT